MKTDSSLVNLNIDCYAKTANHTPVNTVMASLFLLASLGYDSRHLCHIPLTLNFGINSTCDHRIYVTMKGTSQMCC